MAGSIFSFTNRIFGVAARSTLQDPKATTVSGTRRLECWVKKVGSFSSAVGMEIHRSLCETSADRCSYVVNLNLRFHCSQFHFGIRWFALQKSCN